LDVRAIELANVIVDGAESRLLGPGEYGDKSWWFKLAVRLARLTSPIQ
jgi:hypothetical protein